MRRNPWPVYLALAAVFPILALLARNVGQAAVSDGLRAGLVSILAAVTVFLAGWLLLKDLYRAALLSLLLTIIVFSYGHVYQTLEGLAIAGVSLGRHRFLLPAWLALTLVGCVLIIRGRPNARRLTPALNLVAIVLVAMPLTILGVYQLRLERTAVEAARSGQPLPSLQDAGEAPPDIYYIILDAYGREDSLRNVFGYDNSGFLESLKAMGFYVADKSRSNYAQTELSLLSSLEMDYLQALGHDQCDPCARAPRIRNAATVKALDRLGYSLVALESGYDATEWTDADVYLSRGTSSMSRLQLVGGINSLEALLIRTSIGLAILDSTDVRPRALQPVERGPLDDQRELILFQLDQLGRIPNIPGPKFVFAHIVAPHFPYVLGPSGEAVIPDAALAGEVPSGPQWHDEARGYTGQLEYLNKRMLEAVKQILATSARPPVIILQGDHGPWVGSVPVRMQILNAYYLPQEGSSQVNPSISPVNSFRVVLDKYFGAELPLLEDRSYYSPYPRPYDFEFVPGG